jgi:hypothetical protein
MKQFTDLNIAPPEKGFSGDRIKMKKILNRQIVVHRYRIVPSKYQDEGSGKRLDLQIEIDGQMQVTWCGSVTLMETVKKIPESEFPFTTIITTDESDRYIFS